VWLAGCAVVGYTTRVSWRAARRFELSLSWTWGRCEVGPDCGRALDCCWEGRGFYCLRTCEWGRYPMSMHGRQRSLAADRESEPIGVCRDPPGVNEVRLCCVVSEVSGASLQAVAGMCGCLGICDGEFYGCCAPAAIGREGRVEWRWAYVYVTLYKERDCSL
jgi:hypothetical protein